MANPIKNIISLVSGNITDLRSNTYMTTSDNKRQLNKLKTDIHKAVDDINNHSKEQTGLSVSTMYARLVNTMNNPNLPKDFESIFNNDALMDSLSASYMQNRPIYDYDKEIDLICSYMPKLQEALDTKRDHVLSPDHFNKEFLKIVKDSDLSLDGDTVLNMFNKDIKVMKDKYKLEEFIEESYDRVSKYGEDFVYHVPYSKAIEKLLIDRDKYGVRNNANILGSINANIKESGDIDIKIIGESFNGKSISETKNISNDFKNKLKNPPKLNI